MDKLFDFKFNHLITKTVLKVLYAILVALLTIAAVVGVLQFASDGFLVAIVGVVVGYFIVLLLLRVLFEDRLVKFQMAENIKEIRAANLVVIKPEPNNCRRPQFCVAVSFLIGKL